MTASDGIHDTLVTDDSIRMSTSSPRSGSFASDCTHGTVLGAQRRGGQPERDGVVSIPRPGCPDHLVRDTNSGGEWRHDGSHDGTRATDGRITVFLADDNVIVREGVRALLALEPDLEVVGTADDYDSLLAGAEAAAPQVLVTDIRMPPTFQQEGIHAAKELRKRHPGTGVVVLSQYDDPDYAVSLLGDGAAGYAYLLKDRVGEGDQLARAVREVATGGSVLDPKIVEALVMPVTDDAGLTAADEELLHEIAEGEPIKAIAVSRGTTAAAVADAVEALFLKLSAGASSGTTGALKRLRMLHQAIVDREEQGEQLSRLLPGGLAEKLRNEGREIGETEELEVTVLMGDIRGYSGDRGVERPDPARGAAQRASRRDEPRDPRRARHRDAVRRRRGDGVLRRARSARRSRRPRARGRAGDDRASARARRALGGRRSAPRSGWASVCRPVRSPPRCSGRRSASSTRSWATRSTSHNACRTWPDRPGGSS